MERSYDALTGKELLDEAKVGTHTMKAVVGSKTDQTTPFLRSSATIFDAWLAQAYLFLKSRRK